MGSARKSRFKSPSNDKKNSTKSNETLQREIKAKKATVVKISGDSDLSEGEISDVEMSDLVNQASSKILSTIGKSCNRKEEMFVIDKDPGMKDALQLSINCSDNDSEDSCEGYRDKSKNTKKKKLRVPDQDRLQLSSEINCSLDTNLVYVNLNPFLNCPLPSQASVEENNKQSKIMEKSVLQPGFEKQHSINAYSEGTRLIKRERRADRSKTKGGKWFDMQAPEMTPELKDNLSVVQMRRVLDPKRFYKNNDTQALPKYFQMGRVVETAADFYHARVPKKQRKANIVEELLADAKFRTYNKRKYTEIQERKMKKPRSGAFKHMKRLKNRKK